MRSMLTALIALVFATTMATADSIDIHAIGTGSVTQEENHLVNDGTTTEWQIAITCSGGANSVLVVIRPVTSTNSYPIRYIKVKSIRNGTLQNNASIVIDQSEGGVISYIRSFQVVPASPSPDAEVWLTSLNIDGVLGDPGSPHTGPGVFADVVGTIDAGGGITADIIPGPRLFGGTSTISHVGTSNGSIQGHIVAQYGQVLEVTATSSTVGDIGSATNPVAIWAKQAVGQVKANNIYASIDSTVNGGNDDVWFVQARSGRFYGELICRSIASQVTAGGLSVTGDLDANVIVGTNVLEPIAIGGSVLAGNIISIDGLLRDNATDDGRITIGGSLLGDLHVGVNGLAAQVIVNANGTTGGTLSGSLSVGGTSLSGPDYELAASTLGGGSIGLSRYLLNHADCDRASACIAPPCLNNIPIIGLSDFESTGVTLRFYGPVTLIGSGQKVHVYKTNAWGTIDTSVDYGDSSHVVVSSEASNPRGIVVKGLSGAHLDTTVRYMITPVAGAIVCAGVTGTPNVHDFDYSLILTASISDGNGTDWRCGSADFNCDGDAGTDTDIETFFACLAGSCPAAPCTENADFNGDGDTATDTDIEAFFRVLGGGSCAP